MYPPDEAKKIRHPKFPVQPLIYTRWSPRSMTGEEMSDEELFPLFEAARWAPSSFNSQPWRFLYAKRNTPEWDLFFNLLIDFNKEWVKNGAVILCVVSRDTFEHNGKPTVTHSYDTGAAWMALAIEGASRGYVVHGMSGFDFQRAKKELQVPDGYTVEAMAAIGKIAPKEKLPKEMQEKEAPSLRKEIREFALMGGFPKN